MKGLLKIEAIGDDTDQLLQFFTNYTNSLCPGLGDKTFGAKPKPSYWVAQITGFHKVYNYERVFLKGKKDYAHTNRNGSRGIYIYYLVESGNLYEVKRPISWKKEERFYFIITEDGEIQKVDKEYVDQWINKNNPLAFLPY